MRNIGWHNNRFAGFQDIRFAIDEYISLTVNNIHYRIKRSGMLAQSLPLIKGKKRDIAGFRF